MLRRIWLSGMVCAALLGGLGAVPREANAQGLWFGSFGIGGPGYYGSGFSPYGFAPYGIGGWGIGGWGGAGGFAPARVAYPVVVRRPVVVTPRPVVVAPRPVVVAPRPVVVAPTPYAYRHANRVVRRVWRRGW